MPFFSPQRGFTLIEMMVSIALFSFVMVIAAGAYLSLINLERQTRANNDLNTNLSFVSDTMTRAIRTGTNYRCGGIGGGTNCPIVPQSTFAFANSDSPSVDVTYSLSNGAINECVGSAACVAITDPRISITVLNFYVRGVGSGDGTQPQVLVVIHGIVHPDANHTTNFTLQTSATQRSIEL